MDVSSIILSTAKTVKISGTLLLAICSHESNNFTMNYAPHDHGSPSYGACQLKLASARQLGFRGDSKELMNPSINVYWAAQYLKHQEKRYGDNWLKLTSSYNAGSFTPSSIVSGCPRNLRYVKLVQKRLPSNLRGRLNCGDVAKNDH